ncbi:hypothetical protein K402DRAFT_424746 [Aulographum hederae CBS 113979]|uniref:Uncharacterized protein n=1 Tax=Aulographum hederae CBS 113979 TaxID=1176131 RepID=A0A6G1GN29_9PEZI|nr:hypothetical protein K402DRAFT_424746 [Aulographum hederae CBS 113979]
MASPHVLRVQRTDVDEGFVLLNVSSSGPRPLDVKVIGTEDEYVYVAKIKQDRSEGLRASNYQGADEEWGSALSHVLLQQQIDNQHAKNLSGLEIVASIADGVINVTVRKNISGITQRLGAIALKRTSKEDPSLFQWAASASATYSGAQTELASLTAKLEEQQKEVDRLNQQLSSLVDAKKDHEDALLTKFSDLLNSKKLKIRDQQRLLAGAKVDPAVAKKLASSREDGRSRRAGASRAGKRKADAAAIPATVSDEESDGGFEEPMEVDKVEDAEEEEERAQETPEPEDMDESTEDEDEPTKLPATSRARGNGKGKSTTSAKSKEKEVTIPPRRELPFSKGKAKPVEEKLEPKPVVDEDDETESDDEL